MFALVLLAGLTAGTLALAHRLERLPDVGWVIGASLLGGVVFITAHPAIGFVAEPPNDAEATCGGDEIPLLAPVVERISVAEARALQNNSDASVGPVTFVDARPTYHYAAGHIPGAMNLPAEDAEGLLDMQSLPIPPEGQVITYCDGGSCEQSEYLGLLLRERDVCQQVFVLDGGWQAWTAASAPTVVGDSRFGQDAGRSVIDPSMSSVESEAAP